MLDLFCAALYVMYHMQLCTVIGTQTCSSLYRRPLIRWSASPCQISRLSGQKCGNTAPKTIIITNFGHKFAPLGSLVCPIFTKFSDFVRVSRWILSFWPTVRSGLCHRKSVCLSVRPSVCLSVTLVYCGQTA